MSKEAIQKGQFQGHTDEITNEEYHAAPGISSTGFKEFLKSPRHFQTHMQRAPLQTAPLYDGSMFHSIFLDGKTPICSPKFDRRTKEGKVAAEEWDIQNKGALKYDWFDSAAANQAALDRLNGMAESLRKKPSVRDLFQKGAAERSFFVKDEQTNLYTKARTDWLTEDNIIVDIKTTAKSAKSDVFQKTIFDYGYYLSLAWYCRVLSQVLKKKVDTCLLIAVEKTAPYESSVFLLNDRVLELGHRIIAKNLPKLALCKDTDQWPGYDETISEVGVPEWALTKLSWEAGEES